jgi:hypothetical protein
LVTFEDRKFPWKTNIGLMKAEKILSVHPQGVARAYVPLYIEFCWDN